jgi:hypothetical protein
MFRRRLCCRLIRFFSWCSRSFRSSSSQSFSRRLSMRLVFAKELMNHSHQHSKKEIDWRTIIATAHYHQSDSKIWRKHVASKMWKELNIFEKTVLFKSTNMQKAYQSVETAVWAIVDWKSRRNKKSALKILKVRWKDWNL